PGHWGPIGAGVAPPPPRSVLEAFLDDQHRASRVPENFLGDRTEYEPRHASQTPRPDYDEVGVVGRRGRDDHVGRIAGRRRPGHARERAPELRGSLLEHLLELTPALVLDLREHPD